MKGPSVPCGLRGPVAADLRRAPFGPPTETSPPRHPSAQQVLEGPEQRRRSWINTVLPSWSSAGSSTSCASGRRPRSGRICSPPPSRSRIAGWCAGGCARRHRCGHCASAPARCPGTARRTSRRTWTGCAPRMPGSTGSTSCRSRTSPAPRRYRAGRARRRGLPRPRAPRRRDRRPRRPRAGAAPLPRPGGRRPRRRERRAAAPAPRHRRGAPRRGRRARAPDGGGPGRGGRSRSRSSRCATTATSSR